LPSLDVKITEKKKRKRSRGYQNVDFITQKGSVTKAASHEGGGTRKKKMQLRPAKSYVSLEKNTVGFGEGHQTAYLHPRQGEETTDPEEQSLAL